MKNLLYMFSFLNDSMTSRHSEQHVILFDSSIAAADIAFTLKGRWDECNGVVVDKFDEVAVSTAASLVGTSWCDSGAACTLLIRLRTEDLKRRYASGERNFVNANLRCAQLRNLNLNQINLSWAKLSFANLSGANLSGADLTAADLSGANLSGANLSQTDLSRADLRGANLQDAILDGALLRGTKINLPSSY